MCIILHRRENCFVHLKVCFFCGTCVSNMDFTLHAESTVSFAKVILILPQSESEGQRAAAAAAAAAE